METKLKRVMVNLAAVLMLVGTVGFGLGCLG